MIYRLAILFILLAFSTSFNIANSKPCVKSTLFFLSKTFKLKRTSIPECAKYETGNHTIFVDKKHILVDLKNQIPDSIYFKILNYESDTLDLNKIDGPSNRTLTEAIIKQIENETAIIIDTESGERVYKIIRRKYNRKTSSVRRRGGIEYIDAKNKSEILDLGLWIS